LSDNGGSMATEVIETVLRLSLRGFNATAALILFWSFAGGIALVAATASAQADDAATAEVKALEVRPEDYAAARSLDSWCYHTMPGRTPAAKRFSQDGPSTELPGNPFELETSDLPSYQPPSLPNPPTPSFYPDELFNIGLLVSGTTPGPTIVSAQSHPIYLSAPNVGGAGRCATGSCWGNPKQFLTDFGPSTFSHILDQYVGSSALNRYTLGTQFSASQVIFGGTSGTPTFSQNDILALVHAAAKVAGSGLPHIYHVFIPPNVDTCLDAPDPLILQANVSRLITWQPSASAPITPQ